MYVGRRTVLKAGLACAGLRILRGSPGLVASWSTQAPPIHPSDRSKWNNGRFVSCTDGDAFKVPFTISGTDDIKDVHYMFSMENAGRLGVNDFDYDKRGELVFCGGYESAKRDVNGFLGIKPEGSETPATLIPTFPYCPLGLAVAPDGTIWTTGYEVLGDGTPPAHINLKADAIRQFDRSGRLLASTMPWEQLPMNMHVGRPLLKVSTSTFAWYSPGPHQPVLFEMSTENLKVRKYWPGVEGREDRLGFTLLESHQAFLTLGRQLFSLDRDASKWVNVPLKLGDEKGGVLKGDEGGVLVFQAGFYLYFVDPLQIQDSDSEAS